MTESENLHWSASGWRKLESLAHLLQSNEESGEIIAETARFIAALKSSLTDGPLDKRQAAIRRCVDQIVVNRNERRCRITLRRIPTIAGESLVTATNEYTIEFKAREARVAEGYLSQAYIEISHIGSPGRLARPAAPGLELEDPHALDGRVVGASSRGEPAPAGVLDIQLFLEPGDLGAESIKICSEPLPNAPTLTGPTICEIQGNGGERHGMNQG